MWGREGVISGETSWGRLGEEEAQLMGSELERGGGRKEERWESRTRGGGKREGEWRRQADE